MVVVLAAERKRKERKSRLKSNFRGGDWMVVL